METITNNRTTHFVDDSIEPIIKKAQKIDQNLDLNQGLLMSLSGSTSVDRRGGSRVTYGGQGRPMDTSAG
jgi:hypothetical protein